MTGHVWIGQHVYHYGPSDELVVRCLGPVTERLRAAGAVDRGFFLRYWLGGPHVRWRLRTTPADAPSVADAMLAAAQDYLEHQPSTLELDADAYLTAQRALAEREDGVETAGLTPDNTVVQIPYEPEFAKYGGPPGIEFAEELFDESSSIAVRALADILEKPGRRLGLAYAMTMAGLVGTGRSPEEIRAFLTRYCDFWSAYLPGNVDFGWDAGLDRMRPALRGPTARLLDGTGSELTQRWALAVGATHRKAEQLPDVQPGQLLLNYLHTHNNRLGVLPAQEAYIAFLGQHLVGELAGIPAQKINR